MSKIATINVGGVAVPRLAFGLGLLMNWAPNNAYPLPTDSNQEVRQAIIAGFRHFNTGNLYTNNPSAAEVLKTSGLKREAIFFSLKLNTYAILGCKGREGMIESAKREIERVGLEGYVDMLLLHFPPRRYQGNLSNREAWRVLEELKDQGMARIIGVSNWTLDDYRDIMDSADLKYRPQVNQYESNPFLLFDPKFRQLREYEVKHGVVNMNYGFLTTLSGKLSKQSAQHLNAVLSNASEKTSLSEAELILSWAFHKLNGIVVTYTLNAERAANILNLLSAPEPTVSEPILADIERAAREDGYEGKVAYTHPHMEKAKNTSLR